METPMRAPGPRLPTPLELAYIGDAVWELHARRAVIEQGPRTMDEIHRRVVARVQAGEQAALWHRVKDALSDEERDVARRARNAKLSPPRGVSHADYRHGTSFESVLGFLYWTGRLERLQEVMGLADEAIQGQSR